ncbi:hypothetical protein [Paraburkholderia sp.]|uniref:hypothetical protein n=1 Tax=Paraburkholderia sp. TaxID=1926495 RepID=UPI003D6DC168
MHILSDAHAFNEKLDRLLEREGRVDRDTWASFIDAYGYDAATTISWLQAKLNILKRRLEDGGSIYLWDAANSRQIDCVTVQQFNDWVSVHFPSISL